MVVLAAILVSAAPTPAQPPGGDRRPGDEPGRRRPGSERRPPQPGRLIPGFLEEQLKLTAEQKKQIEGLQKEVDDKIKEAQIKLDKILTAEQKKTLQAMRERGGRPGRPGGPAGGPDSPGRRPNGPPAAPSGPPPGFEGGPPRPGQVLPSFLQERLKLTTEQRKQIEELQKDMDAKLNKILTEEQKQELREMRERGGRAGRPDGPRPAGGRWREDRPRREERPPRPPE
jgi:Spy/CpxP family protein refolding chaperone